jgi:hypothetical protein
VRRHSSSEEAACSHEKIQYNLNMFGVLMVN